MEEWNKVSEAQQLFHLKTFLESRGYYGLRSQKSGKQLVATLPAQRLVSTWELQGAEEVDQDTFRKIVSEPLTPKLLDSITARVRLELENRGYPCATIQTKGDAATGKVWTKVERGTIKRITQMKREPITGLKTDVLSRYEGFKMGDLFTRDALRLAENRIASEGILQDVHYEVDCEKEGAHLTQKSVAGPPRLFILGIGVNTEKGPSAKVTWSHLRLGERASSIGLTLTGSFKEQRFETVSDWYFSDSLNRFHLSPSLSVSHENENTYERYEGQLRLTPATSWDGQRVALRASFGPTLNLERTISGLGPRNSRFLAFDGKLRITDHGYELYQTSPRSGYEIYLSDASTFHSILSPVTASKLNLRFSYLWNLLDWDPPSIIFGFRGGAAVTVTEENLLNTSVLPSSFRNFLGGSSDLRGFSRLTLPGPEGALTSVYFGTEMRFLSILPWNLQPFLFTDFGKMGKKSFSFDREFYWCPGVGMRWESAIGVFRSTLARGITNGVGQGTTLYLSYGEEF